MHMRAQSPEGTLERLSDGSGCTGAARPFRETVLSVVGLRLTSLASYAFWMVVWLKWLEIGLSYLYLRRCLHA